MLSPSKMWNGFKSYIYKNYGENPGSMLVHTGVIGWILSAAAQIYAVAFNDKISKEQKVFLIPQEIGDAVVNIASFYTLTSGIKYIGSKLAKTAKLRTSAITDILKKDGHILEKGQKRVDGKVYAGDWNFNITNLDNYGTDIASKFKPFKNGVEVIAGLTGSILSSNLVTPLVRNQYAAKKQKEVLANIDKNKTTDESSKLKYPSDISMNAYMKLASVKFSSGSLKI